MALVELRLESRNLRGATSFFGILQSRTTFRESLFRKLLDCRFRPAFQGEKGITDHYFSASLDGKGFQCPRKRRGDIKEFSFHISLQGFRF